MKKYFFSVILASSTMATAQTTFPLGQGLESWGVKLQVPESELSLKLGARYQSLATSETEENLDTNKKTTSQDFQSRRVRFQLQADLAKKASFSMDLRNDSANQGDKGEQKFIVGDAFVSIPLLQVGDSVHMLRMYRAKVDVSRSQTVSSSELLFLNRAYIADEAAQYVSHNRRATNIQLIGSMAKKMSYQFVLGDGVYSEKFIDAKGESATSIERQNFMIGAKLRFYPFKDMEDIKPTETYFGLGKHFSFGLGAFNTSNIEFTNDANSTGKTSRNLYNAEISGHYQDWSFQAEYFKMDGVIKDIESTTGFNKGQSEGWYAQLEKVFTPSFLAPFIRYERWDRFQNSGDYESDSTLYGLNWYLNGNRFRVTAAYQIDNFGKDIEGAKMKVEKIHLATMWHF